MGWEYRNLKHLLRLYGVHSLVLNSVAIPSCEVCSFYWRDVQTDISILHRPTETSSYYRLPISRNGEKKKHLWNAGLHCQMRWVHLPKIHLLMPAPDWQLHVAIIFRYCLCFSIPALALFISNTFCRLSFCLPIEAMSCGSWLINLSGRNLSTHGILDRYYVNRLTRYPLEQTRSYTALV